MVGAVGIEPITNARLRNIGESAAPGVQGSKLFCVQMSDRAGFLLVFAEMLFFGFNSITNPEVIKKGKR